MLTISKATVFKSFRLKFRECQIFENKCVFEVEGLGDCGFLCLMIAINSDKNVSRWFDNALQDCNKKLGNNMKKTQSLYLITQLIGKFKKLFFQFHIKNFEKLLGER